MVRHGTVAVTVRCGCGSNWTMPVELGRDALRWLAQSGASADMLVSTMRCRRCGTVNEQRLGDLVPWREAA